MPALQNLLAVYGVLDQAVVRDGTRSSADAPIVLDANFVGFSDAWESTATDDIAGESDADSDGGTRGADGQGARRPDLATALESIKRDADAGERLSTPKKVRLFAALADIARVQSNRAPITLPMFDSADAEPDSRLVDALVALGPDDVPVEQRRARVLAAAPDLFAAARNARTLADFQMIISEAADYGVLPNDARYVGTCTSDEVVINGYECIVIDTECKAPDVSLNDLKAVVNPFNWAKNYPLFFVSMDAAGLPQGDAWPNVIETVSLLGAGLDRVRTQLEYYTSEDSNGTAARIDYDLAQPYPGEGDSQVRVDRGWINMWCANATNDPAQPGVQARTRKIVHIDGVSTKLQKLVPLLGYGDQSAEFLLGSAKRRPPIPGLQPFGYKGADPATAGASNRAQQGTTSTAPHFAPTAVDIWTRAMRKTTSDYVDVASKWMAGQLTIEDVANYATTTTDHLIRAPFEFLEAMTKPRTPPRTQSRGGDQT